MNERTRMRYLGEWLKPPGPILGAGGVAVLKGWADAIKDKYPPAFMTPKEDFDYMAWHGIVDKEVWKDWEDNV
jgi:hypothetical protein